MRLFSHSPADSSLPELAPPCSRSAVLHVTWVLSISRSTAITSLCKYSGWYPTFHALLSHHALVATWYKHLPWMHLLVGHCCSIFCSTQGIKVHHSGLSETCQVSHVTDSIDPFPILCWEGTCISYIHSTITFWDASSRRVWDTDTDGKHEVQSQHAITQPGSNDLCLQSLKAPRSLPH